MNKLDELQQRTKQWAQGKDVEFEEYIDEPWKEPFIRSSPTFFNRIFNYCPRCKNIKTRNSKTCKPCMWKERKLST
ncbi:hypothetical protein CMI37_11560 [Candidatus Pacearchaeota archaeon]|nr:hypothetical protein [Candidatus Pacearchaeota archaeon]|tara:strand:- start:8814 stop:9041 length:228 start_codon:yes stop_codon:yes gene_type:complete